MSEPTSEDLLASFRHHRAGEVRGLHAFAFLPAAQLERLAKLVLDENWGKDNFVLTKYLAEHVPLSLAQGRYATFDNQLIVTAGSLQTRYGTPVYVVFEPNGSGAASPWSLRGVTDRPRAALLPQPPDLPEWPTIDPGSEVVIGHEHILEDNEDRVRFLSLRRASRRCVRSLGPSSGQYIASSSSGRCFGTQSYFVPVYLTSREDITAASRLGRAGSGSTGVCGRSHAAATSHATRPSSCVAANRADQLPSWLLRAWAEHAEAVGDDAGADPDE
jgi:hypothetical protein